MSAKKIFEENSLITEATVKQVTDENARLFNDLENALSEFEKAKKEIQELTAKNKILEEANVKLTRERDHFQTFSYNLEQHLNLPKIGDQTMQNLQAPTKIINKTNLAGVELIRKNSK